MPKVIALPTKESDGSPEVGHTRSARSEDGLNSYDLAHRAGSRVDSFKRQMMSSSDVTNSAGLSDPGFCSRLQTRCALIVKSNSSELFFALMLPGIPHKVVVAKREKWSLKAARGFGLLYINSLP